MPIAERRLAELQWSYQDIKLKCFTVYGGTLSAYIGISSCAESCGMWNTHWPWSNYIYTKRHKRIRGAKFGRINRFVVKNETEDQDQSIPKSIGTLTVLRCILVQIWKASLHLVLTYRPDKLTSPKWGKFWLLSSIWPWNAMSMTPENNRDLNQGVCTSDPILVIVAWEGDKLSSWQTDDWRTHTHTQTDADDDNTRRP